MDRHPTARRLIEEGMRLFAERGTAGVPITHIEEAAGLAPGSGAFYRHFPSKQAVYVAAIEDAAADMAAIAGNVPLRASTDPRGDLEEVARVALDALDSRRHLILVTAREGPPAGVDLDERLWPATGHRAFADWLAVQHAAGVLDAPDHEAAAVVAVAALTAHWMHKQTATGLPLGIDDDRFIAAWTRTLCPP